MAKPVYQELAVPSRVFYRILGLLFVCLVAAACSFMYIEHHGHYVTGMSNQVVWGLPHVVAIFLIIAASGAANVGSLATVFKKTVYQPFGRLSVVVAISFLLGGLTILVLDLGRPDRLIIALTHYNAKSVFAWNILLYNGFLVIMAVYLWSMMDRRRSAKASYQWVGYLGFIWRFILTTGTGSIFGFLVARQYYDAAIMAPLFIALSYVLGTASFIILLNVISRLTGIVFDREIFTRLRDSLALFISLVLFLVLVRHLTNLYATEHHGVEQYILREGGAITWLFWLGQIIVGSVLPLLLLWLPVLKRQKVSALAAAVLAIIGGFSLLYVTIVGGQLYPLELFANASIESGHYEGMTAGYTASLPELGLSLGGVALSMLLILLASSALRLIPSYQQR